MHKFITRTVYLFKYYSKSSSSIMEIDVIGRDFLRVTCFGNSIIYNIMYYIIKFLSISSNINT